jgi:hypothetical protein
MTTLIKCRTESHPLWSETSQLGVDSLFDRVGVFDCHISNCHRWFRNNKPTLLEMFSVQLMLQISYNGSPSRAVILEKTAGNDFSCWFCKRSVIRCLDSLADDNGSDENEADDDAVSIFSLASWFHGLFLGFYGVHWYCRHVILILFRISYTLKVDFFYHVENKTTQNFLLLVRRP